MGVGTNESQDAWIEERDLALYRVALSLMLNHMQSDLNIFRKMWSMLTYYSSRLLCAYEITQLRIFFFFS